MPTTDEPIGTTSSRTLTYAAYVSFVPIGIATVLLGSMLPILSARWSFNYSQSGALFDAQYFASTCSVALSGVLAARWGFRFPMKVGLVLMALGLAFLLSGSKALGILCIAAYGGGLGLAVRLISWWLQPILEGAARLSTFSIFSGALERLPAPRWCRPLQRVSTFRFFWRASLGSRC